MPEIMVIEDNESIKKEIIEILVRYGYEAYSSTDFQNVL